MEVSKVSIIVKSGSVQVRKERFSEMTKIVHRSNMLVFKKMVEKLIVFRLTVFQKKNDCEFCFHRKLKDKKKRHFGSNLEEKFAKSRFDFRILFTLVVLPLSSQFLN